ncbi:MAG: hypothetical protein ACUZ8O_05995 [Candidatus Anammoxibacter sp.]
MQDNSKTDEEQINSFQYLIREVKHAFYIETSGGTSFDNENEFLERFADGITRRKLAAPALLFLETFKPLNYIGNQAMVFFRPFVSMIFPIVKYDKMLNVLEKRGSISRLIKLLEKKT